MAPPYGGAKDEVDKEGRGDTLSQDPAVAPSYEGAMSEDARENPGRTRSAQARCPRMGARGLATPGEERQAGGASAHPPCAPSEGTHLKGVAQGGEGVRWPSQGGTPFEGCVTRPLLVSVGICHTGRVALRRGECGGLPHPSD